MKEGKENESTSNMKNVVILSLGFMLLMAAWLTTAAMAQAIIQSSKEDDPSFQVNGYVSLAIVNVVFSLSNFIAPAIVTFAGVRTALVFGCAMYSAFIASLIYPKAWLVYSSSALLGFGAAIVWVANGCFFAKVCTKENIGKYLGIYWSIMALGQVSGSAFVFWKFQGSNHIEYDTRLMVISVLTCICIGSSITMMFVAPGSSKKGTERKDSLKMSQSGSLCSAFTEPFRILGNKHMLLLIPPSLMNGLEITFFGAVFPSTVGFTEAFGGDTRKLVGMVGIMVGVGSLVGGFVLGIFGDKTVKSNRSIIVGISCTSFCLSSLLMYINHPNAAPLGPTMDVSWMNPPSVIFSMISAFLLGFGDGGISPQMTAAIGVIWPDNPSAALALSRFFQAGSTALGFFISTQTGLYNQVIIFSAVSIFGATTYALNEMLIRKKQRLELEPVNQIHVLSESISYVLNPSELTGKQK